MIDPPLFVTVQGAAHTAADLRPRVMRALRAWRFLGHLQTLEQRQAYADAWLACEALLRPMNGMIPARVIDAIVERAILKEMPE